MYIFEIRVIKDFTEVEKNLKGVGLTVYKALINNIVWGSIFKFLAPKVLNNYENQVSDTELIAKEYNENKEILEKEKLDFERFIFGDISKLGEQQFFKSCSSNRWFSKFYNKIKSFVSNQMEKNNILFFFSACSLTVSWELKEVIE